MARSGTKLAHVFLFWFCTIVLKSLTTRTSAWMLPFEYTRCSRLGFTTHLEFRIEMWPNMEIANLPLCS